MCSLQTDTSLAIEAKSMQRWEFDSIDKAASCISSWFSGTISEQLQLKEHLNSAAGSILCSHDSYFCGLHVNNFMTWGFFLLAYEHEICVHVVGMWGCL